MQSVVPEVLQVLTAPTRRRTCRRSSPGLRGRPAGIRGSSSTVRRGDPVPVGARSVRRNLLRAGPYFRVLADRGGRHQACRADPGRGEYTMPDEDLMAGYVPTRRGATPAGYNWYEVSNYSRSEDTRNDHNPPTGAIQDWWGIGPGAHSLT